MGRASRWFKSFIGYKSTSNSSPTKDKKSKKWSLARPSTPEPANSYEADVNKHAISVAEATTAVAEAALAAVQAVAEVVRLTSGGSVDRTETAAEGGLRRRECAAVNIQSAFRGYLARRALRALKGLVRLQALVRGHIVRRQSADMLQRLQALSQIQARVCANRAQNAQAKVKNKGFVDTETALQESNWLNRWMEECSRNTQGATSLATIRLDDDKNKNTLEVDTCYPHLNFNNRIKNFKTSSTKNPNRIDETDTECRAGSNSVMTNENSPQVSSSASRPGSNSGGKGHFTPTSSECSGSFFNSYSGYPNYMANTESYRQKVRSQSAPRQRSPCERMGSRTRFYDGYCDLDIISENGSALLDSFRNKVFLGSGKFDRACVSSARQL